MMETVTNTGTEIKVSVRLECGRATMDEMDFEADFFTSSARTVHVTKSEMVRSNDGTYTAVIDTEGMQTGDIHMRVRAEIPDIDCPDGWRTEIATIDTGIPIRR